MNDTNSVSISSGRRIADIVFAVIGLLIAGRFILTYEWPVWQKVAVLFAIIVFLGGITWARWTLPRRP
jgi:hypothetical protein